MQFQFVEILLEALINKEYDRYINNRKRKEIRMSKVIKLGQYKGVQVELKKQPVTEEEIQGEMQRLLESHAKYEDKDTPVENGDMTIIDFEGFKDGVAFDGGKGTDYSLEIGSGSFIPGFEEQMIGMKKGETKDLELTFPKNYGVADLAGANVIFKVTVHNIQSKVKTELNDEFVASLNAPDIKTVDDLHANIKSSLEMYHEQNFNGMKENAIFDHIMNDSKVELDDKDIEEAVNNHILYIRNDLQNQGLQLEQYLEMMGTNMENFKQQLVPNASKQAQFEAIIDEIVKVEDIHTPNQEVEEHIQKIASHHGLSTEDVLEKVSKELLQRDLNRLKANQLVMDNAIVKEL